jgi:hypothetical protein
VGVLVGLEVKEDVDVVEELTPSAKLGVGLENLPVPLVAEPFMLPVREVDTVSDVVEDTELQVEAVRLGVFPNDPDEITVKLGLLETVGAVDALRVGVTVKEAIEDTEPYVEVVKKLLAVVLGCRDVPKLPPALLDTRGDIEELPEAASVVKSVTTGVMVSMAALDPVGMAVADTVEERAAY